MLYSNVYESRVTTLFAYFNPESEMQLIKKTHKALLFSIRVASIREIGIPSSERAHIENMQIN